MMMAEDNQNTNGKGKVFFERAREVAETGNWDFAIELYLEGIMRDLDNLEEGHHPLRHVALTRTLNGGKKPGLRDQLKHRPSKDPIENLCNAEFLLAKEPGSLQYMRNMLKAVTTLDKPKLIKWICDIMLESQRSAKKPDKNVLMILMGAYEGIEDFGCAVIACDLVIQLTPNDETLREIKNDLSTRFTIQKGGYGDEDSDFTQAVKDMDRQKELAQLDSLVKSEDHLQGQIEAARAEYQQSPTATGKINAFVAALLKIEDKQHESEAIEVLQKALAELKAYQFKMQIGDIKMKQLSRRSRELIEAGDKEGAKQLTVERLEMELKEYTERAENYPTDLAIRFELGRRLFLAGNFDEAIVSLQQAQRYPRRHVQALAYLGQSFARKGLHPEAADTFERALKSDMDEERSKEIRYHFARSLEEMDELEKAQGLYSEVAQLDYNYRDVRSRLEDVRKRLREGKK